MEWSLRAPLTFIDHALHYIFSLGSIFGIGSEQRPGPHVLLVAATVSHIPEKLVFLFQQRYDLLVLLMKLFCGLARQDGVRREAVIQRVVAETQKASCRSYGVSDL